MTNEKKTNLKRIEMDFSMPHMFIEYFSGWIEHPSGKVKLNANIISTIKENAKKNRFSHSQWFHFYFRYENFETLEY